MIKEKLIEDLKKVVESEPDVIGRYGTEYHLFSVKEIKGIIEVLERQC